MRDWFVGGAIIQAGCLTGSHLGELELDTAGARAAELSGVLLVENLRQNGKSDWTTPGGVIDPGESLLEGLTREVREETGLEVVRWSGLLYEIRVEAPGLEWRLRVEVHLAQEVAGEVTLGQDPDGIVIGSDWVSAQACDDRLRHAQPWVREPLLEWITERFETPRLFEYELHGDAPHNVAVTRK
ncbi:MAG: NUDIX domain-containing protein [Actinomycetes bacterium]